MMGLIRPGMSWNGNGNVLLLMKNAHCETVIKAQLNKKAYIQR
jgi:hypothetical protein